jgi:hypothetical protein
MGYICVHQPTFLPWLGILEAMLVCDVFVMDDDVQYEAGGFQNRNRILTSAGPKWITVPVSTRFPQLLSDVAISPEFNRLKTLRTISLNYSKCPHFSVHYDDIADCISSLLPLLVELNVAILKLMHYLFKCRCKLVFPAELGVGKREDKRARLIELAKASECNVFFTGSGSRSYLDVAMFERAGLTVIWQDFEKRHPIYLQRFRQGEFSPNLSFIDLLFNAGAQSARSILESASPHSSRF